MLDLNPETRYSIEGISYSSLESKTLTTFLDVLAHPALENYVSYYVKEAENLLLLPAYNDDSKLDLAD
jgi:hypothetical protein